MLLACLVAIPVLRRRSFEVFVKSHVFLSIATMFAIWQHVNAKRLTSRILVLSAVSLWGAVHAFHIGLSIFRSALCRATLEVKEIEDALIMDVVVPRPWKIRGGDYVHLWIPGASFRSFWQSYPFVIAWWTWTQTAHHRRRLTVHALTDRRLGDNLKLTANTHTRLFTLLSGPFGQGPALGEFGTVVLITTGMGISAHLPMIKTVIEECQSFRARTRKLRLLWQVDQESMCRSNITNAS